MTVLEGLDLLMETFSQGSYHSEALAAKTSFAEWMGGFDEESPHFETKMRQYNDWYLFSRPLQEKGQTPVNLAVDANIQWGAEQLELLKNFQKHKHSLFEFIKLKNNDVFIRDLFSGEKITVSNSDVTLGFEKGQFFEARLIPNNESFVFSNGFCLQPPEASKSILKEIKKIKKSKDVEDKSRLYEALLWDLLVRRNKLDRYSHVGLKQIYDFNVEAKPNAEG